MSVGEIVLTFLWLATMVCWLWGMYRDGVWIRRLRTENAGYRHRLSQCVISAPWTNAEVCGHCYRQISQTESTEGSAYRARVELAAPARTDAGAQQGEG